MHVFLQATAGWNWQKSQANAKQHPEAEFLLVKNHPHSSSTLSSKNSWSYSKKSKKTSVSVFMRLYD